MNSIRRRLTLAVLAAVALVALASAALLYPALSNWLADEFDQALLAKARALTSFADPAREGVNLQFTEAALPEFETPAATEWYDARLENGTSLAKSASLGPRELAIPNAGAEPFFWTLEMNGRPARAVTLRFGESGETSVLVTFVKTRLDLDRTRRGLLVLVMLGLLAVLAFSALATRRAIAFGLHPLDRLTREVRAAALETRFDSAGAPLELQPVAQELNRLMDRLQSAFERERLFSGNAAHELSTPVAELRSVTDVALKWQGDPAGDRAALQSASEIAIQMEAKIRALLSLARAESAREQIRLSDIRLSDLVSELLSSLHAKVSAKRLRVTTALDDSTVRSDEAMLRSIVFNLLDNAVSYTDAGGAIHCTIERHDCLRLFTVRNGRHTLADSDLPHLFTPFWRKDPARADGSHSGLGLALARACAEALDLELTLSLDRQEFVARLSGLRSP